MFDVNVIKIIQILIKGSGLFNASDDEQDDSRFATRGSSYASSKSSSSSSSEDATTDVGVQEQTPLSPCNSY